jgi:hypothetical protein
MVVRAGFRSEIRKRLAIELVSGSGLGLGLELGSGSELGLGCFELGFESG